MDIYDGLLLLLPVTLTNVEKANLNLEPANGHHSAKMMAAHLRLGRPTDNDGPAQPVGPDQGFHLATTSQEIRDRGPGTNPLVTLQQIQHCATKSKPDAILDRVGDPG